MLLDHPSLRALGFWRYQVDGRVVFPRTYFPLSSPEG